MAGDWTTDDLPGVLSAFAANMRDMIPPFLHKLRNAVLSVQPGHHDNTIEGARENIHQHYDLSNELFKLFLDETMTYSSALFAGEPQRLARDARRRAAPQDRPAARLPPASATGTRRARDRHRLGRAGAARRRPRRDGHHADHLDRAGRARRRNASTPPARPTGSPCCCRTTARSTGRYDAVVSVEMIEAVGANHWNTYFETIDRVLAPGGRVGLQAILQDDYTVLATKDTYTWIRKYIFPGGQLASVEAIERTLAAHTSLRVADRYSFNRHYAETLHRWRVAFEATRRRGRRAGLRRDLPPHVVAVPGLLRGGLPHRVPRRPAVHADEGR